MTSFIMVFHLNSDRDGGGRGREREEENQRNRGVKKRDLKTKKVNERNREK